MAISPNTAWEVDAANGSDSNGGAFLAGSSGTDKTHVDNSTPPAGVARTDLAITAIGAPAAPTVSNSATGGTVAAGTYYFQITYVSYYGTTGAETNASANASTTTTGTTSSITVNSPAAAVGATHYQVYASTSSGGTYFLCTGTNSYGTPIGTNLTIAATPPTSGTNPPPSDKSYVNVTSAATAFDATDVGNTIQVSAGTGWTSNFYQVVAFDPGTGKATLDHSPTSNVAPGGNGTGVLGGALATVAKLGAHMVGSNKVFVRYAAGGYAITNTTEFLFSGFNVTPGDGQSSTAPPTRVVGYYQARGDIYPLAAGGYNNNAFRPTFTQASGTVLFQGGDGCVVENLVLDSVSIASSTTLNLGRYCTARNLLVRNFGTCGIQLGVSSAVDACEVTGGLPGATAIRGGSGPLVVANCHVHDNACPGVYIAAGSGTIVDNLIVNNTGGSSDGIQAGAASVILRNTIRGNGRHGIYNSTANAFGYLWRDNVLALNGGYGLCGAGVAGVAASPSQDGNAYFSNTLGARLNADDTTVPVNAVGAYTNRLDVTLAGNPFQADATGNPATCNYAPNATAGAGAAIKGAASPQSFPGNTGTASTPSFGAAQPSPAAAGGGGISKGRALGGM